MNAGIVSHSTDAETTLGAFRFGDFALREGEEVKSLSFESTAGTRSPRSPAHDKRKHDVTAARKFEMVKANE